MALSADTIASSIATLSVPGVTVLGLDEIPETVTGRDCPLMYPRPDGFMSNLRVERVSFGPASSAAKDVRYTLHYTFLLAPVGDGRGLFDVYADMVSYVLAILDAIIADDALNGTITGVIDITPQGVVRFGLVASPAGGHFHGAQLSFEVLEHVN